MVAATYHFTLGDFKCISFNEGNREGDADRMFSNVAAEERARVLAEFDLPGIVPNAINVLYLDTGDHHILVDTGLGQGALYAGLQAEGIAFDSIDRIIITHGHGDHMGGILDADNRLVFPNAHYTIGRREWQHWHEDPANRNAALWQRILAHLPVERITFVENEGEFLPGFSAVFMPGHTPGMMGLLIDSAGDRMLHVADVAHHGLQCAYPDWCVDFDEDKVTARQTRQRMWDRAARENLLVFSYHIWQSGRGYVVANGNTWTWQSVTTGQSS